MPRLEREGVGTVALVGDPDAGEALLEGPTAAGFASRVPDDRGGRAHAGQEGVEDAL